MFPTPGLFFCRCVAVGKSCEDSCPFFEEPWDHGWPGFASSCTPHPAGAYVLAGRAWGTGGGWSPTHLYSFGCRGGVGSGGSVCRWKGEWALGRLGDAQATQLIGRGLPSCHLIKSAHERRQRLSHRNPRWPMNHVLCISYHGVWRTGRCADAVRLGQGSFCGRQKMDKQNCIREADVR
jgi:hypothetical protein